MPFRASVLDAVVMLHTAWSNVLATTIANCFHNCGFRDSEEEEDEEQEDCICEENACSTDIGEGDLLIASKQLLLIQPLRQQWRTG